MFEEKAPELDSRGLRAGGWGGAGEGAVLPRSQINFVGTRGLFPRAAIKGRPSPDGCPGLGVGSLDGRLPLTPPGKLGNGGGHPNGTRFSSRRSIPELSRRCRSPEGTQNTRGAEPPGALTPTCPDGTRRSPPSRSTGGVPAPPWFPPPPPPGAVVPPLLKHLPPKKSNQGKQRMRWKYTNQ